MLTYTGTETHVSFGLFIPDIHFFGQGLQFFLPPKGLRNNIDVIDFFTGDNEFNM